MPQRISLQLMQDLRGAVEQIVREREVLPKERSVLVGVSGIDGCGKGHVARQLETKLAQQSITTANVNIDGWLNLPNNRFNAIEPAQHFYENAIRFDELFERLLLPLRDHRSVDVIADFTEETAENYRQHIYSFENVDVVIAEGIFLFKTKYRKLLDLAIWIDCSFATALSRALERTQEGLSSSATISVYESIYFPAQRIHLERDRPREFADLTINNDPCPLANKVSEDI